MLVLARARESPETADSIKILINGARKIFYPPSQPPRDPGSPGAAKLGLEWVYGYRGSDQNRSGEGSSSGHYHTTLSRNLWVLEKGELVYYVGAVAVVYNRMDERQRHYRGHTEDISCMDLHPLGDTVVSGQGAGQGAEQGAQVHVWNVQSMDTLQVGGHGMSRWHLTHLRRCWAWAPCRGAWRGLASPPSTRAPTWWRWTAARTRCRYDVY